MQRAVFQQATPIKFDTQSTCNLAGDTQSPASNDENYLQEESVLMKVLSVCANVVGGTLLLFAMFYLPHVIAQLLS